MTGSSPDGKGQFREPTACTKPPYLHRFRRDDTSAVKSLLKAQESKMSRIGKPSQVEMQNKHTLQHEAIYLPPCWYHLLVLLPLPTVLSPTGIIPLLSLLGQQTSVPLGCLRGRWPTRQRMFSPWFCATNSRNQLVAGLTPVSDACQCSSCRLCLARSACKRRARVLWLGSVGKELVQGF